MGQQAEDYWLNFLQTAEREFRRYKVLAERAMGQLEFPELTTSEKDGTNSIAIIVKHMAGNMQSRFTNILEEDGEKAWRDRDSEFREPYKTRKEMMAAWEAGWTKVFSTLHSLEGEAWHTELRIRREPHTLVEAILRQLSHYASHTGQIVYIAKAARGDQFKNLSIPKGGSREFNEGYFKGRGSKREGRK